MAKSQITQLVPADPRFKTASIVIVVGAGVALAADLILPWVISPFDQYLDMSALGIFWQIVRRVFRISNLLVAASGVLAIIHLSRRTISQLATLAMIVTSALSLLSRVSFRLNFTLLRLWGETVNFEVEEILVWAGLLTIVAGGVLAGIYMARPSKEGG